MSVVDFIGNILREGAGSLYESCDLKIGVSVAVGLQKERDGDELCFKVPKLRMKKGDGRLGKQSGGGIRSAISRNKSRKVMNQFEPSEGVGLGDEVSKSIVEIFGDEAIDVGSGLFYDGNRGRNLSEYSVAVDGVDDDLRIALFGRTG